jgi:hypothetical protein
MKNKPRMANQLTLEMHQSGGGGGTFSGLSARHGAVWRV